LNDKEAELAAKMEEHQKNAITIETQILQIQQQIDRKTKQLNNLVYSISDLEKRITAFYAGWLTFITNLRNNTDLKIANEGVMSEFRNLHLRKSDTQFQNASN